ncbi:unnamed protein product [Diatraea saccharalis]|uniref:Exonuclease domain-containing protein n=1 Tax=Diatraea saccharalis TaxID=40085 RepID=A0A9N9WIV9_9NEOP|nr:unnamed protein product [Diatraea saccharalis]
MPVISTYVFLDLETTGLPVEEHNKTKITEISMVAVKREHVLDTRPGASPRVQNKVTLCLNPGRFIHPDCTKVTGLCNDLLEHESQFDLKVFHIINNFLDILQKPVCLIAQNGTCFDFPIVKRQLEKLGANFSDDLMCADCYHAFYDILEFRKKSMRSYELIREPTVTTTISETDNSTVIPDNDNLLKQENTLNMKTVNETTPKRSVNSYKFVHKNVCKAKRRFPWSGEKPKESYKLANIYERVMNRPALEAHRAENDCILALECAVALGKDFVDWVDNNHYLFTDVKPMTIGVRLGS